MMKSQPTRAKASSIELGVWARPSSGEEENGDCYLVKFHEDHVLIGVADGLGHGKEASHAARVAMNCIELRAGESLISLFRCCHEELKNTPGTTPWRGWVLEMLLACSFEPVRARSRSAKRFFFAAVSSD
jgi:serine/threonine protein phosphatase PrpC